MRPYWWHECAFHPQHFARIYERETMRAYLRHDLREHGVPLPQLAAEVGLCPGTMRAFLQGRMPSTETDRLLRDWTYAPAARDRPMHRVTSAEVALSALAECYPAPLWRAVRRGLACDLGDVYRAGVWTVPDWIQEGEER